MATDERRAAEDFENRRGDMREWAVEPSVANVRRSGSVVFSLRFGREELENLRQRADIAGVTISEFIRRAALRDAVESQPHIYYAAQPDAGAYRYFLSIVASSGEDQFATTLPLVDAAS